MRSKFVKIFVVLPAALTTLIILFCWQYVKYSNFKKATETGVPVPADIQAYMNIEMDVCVILGHAENDPPNLSCREFLSLSEENKRLLIVQGEKGGHIKYYRAISIETLSGFSNIDGGKRFMEAVNRCEMLPACKEKRIENNIPDLTAIKPKSIQKLTSVKLLHYPEETGVKQYKVPFAADLREREDYIISLDDDRIFSIWYDYLFTSPDSDYYGFYLTK
jgi:hypothetical protein